MNKILIFSFIMVLVAIGCEKTGLKGDQPALVKTQWVLSSIQDTRTKTITTYPIDATSKISIDFTDSLNLVRFHGICNGGRGIYSYSSITGSIQIFGLGSTYMACKYVEWEQYTIQNLHDAFSYKINGNNLVIYSSGKYNLYFTQT